MTIPTLTLNDGRSIPQLGFGVWQVPGGRTAAVVSTALETGYRHIDTATDYGNERGVGEALRDSGIPRDELFVTTKLNNPDQGRARAALEDSLDLLGLDYVDLYLIHWPVPRAGLFVRAWHALEQAQADGLARSIGVSNFTPRFLDQILTDGTVVPAVNQVEYHPTFQQRDVAEKDAAHGIVTEAYSPLGMGTGPRNEVVGRIAERLGRTSAQVILRWHLQQGRVAIPKSVTPSRIAENFAVAGFELSAADLAAIDALDTGQYLGWDPEHV